MPTIDLDSTYNAIAAAETGGEVNPFIRTRVRPDKGSSAYGPVQLTGTLAKDYLTRFSTLFSSPEKNYLSNFVGQANQFNLHGNMAGKLPNYDPKFDYGGTGTLTNLADRSMYTNVTKKIIGDMMNKSTNGTEGFLKAWRGVSDQPYTQKIMGLLKKSADAPVWLPGVAAGTALLAGFAIQWNMEDRLKDALKAVNNVKKKDIPRILAHSQVSKKMPVVRLPNTENAFYGEPGTAERLFPEPELYLSVKKQLTRAQMKHMEELGVIGYDPKFSKPSILSHEAGHAAIRTTKPWYNLSRINQSVLRPLSNVASVTALMGATSAGAITRNPLIGAGVGLGLGALTSLPTLVNEYQASNYARRYLDDSKLSRDQHALNRQILNKAFNTYLAGAIVLPTLFGVVGGVVGTSAPHRA